MPHTARIILPNLPHHGMHRGHNRHVVFAHDADYQSYLDNLWEWKQTLGCRVYAYCLMTNHVHLVVDPGHNPARLSHPLGTTAGQVIGVELAGEPSRPSIWMRGISAWGRHHRSGANSIEPASGLPSRTRPSMCTALSIGRHYNKDVPL